MSTAALARPHDQIVRLNIAIPDGLRTLRGDLILSPAGDLLIDGLDAPLKVIASRTYEGDESITAPLGHILVEDGYAARPLSAALIDQNLARLVMTHHGVTSAGRTVHELEVLLPARHTSEGDPR